MTAQKKRNSFYLCLLFSALLLVYLFFYCFVFSDDAVPPFEGKKHGAGTSFSDPGKILFPKRREFYSNGAVLTGPDKNYSPELLPLLLKYAVSVPFSVFILLSAVLKLFYFGVILFFVFYFCYFIFSYLGGRAPPRFYLISPKYILKIFEEANNAIFI